MLAAWLIPAGLASAQRETPQPETAVEAVTSADAKGLQFFEARIRPVLVERCYKCHSAESDTVEGGLLLDSRKGSRAGGDSGPAVVPFHPEESVLLGAVRHETFEMPPDGKLPDAVIADFEKWIELGAPDPREGPAPARTPGVDWVKQGDFWSFQPIQPPAVPRDADWSRSPESGSAVAEPIDRFIASKLAEAGLAPAAEADRHTLVRWLYFDLWGLPPSEDELQDFVQSDDPNEYARLVDRLLASPHFGERWGRHWLDLARYADSTGGSTSSVLHDAWKYRDYVVASFNDDKPYDEFIAEQIAGDLLPAEGVDERAENLTATGFLMLGPRNYVIDDELLLRMDGIDEQIDTIGRVFLGMTIGCARCHDHKFDPIPTVDYYALAGIFDSTESYVPLPGSKNFTWRTSSDPRQDPDGSLWAEYRRVTTRLGQIKDRRKEIEKARTNTPTSPRTKDVEAIALDPSRSLSPEAEIRLLEAEAAELNEMLPEKPPTLMAVAAERQPGDMRLRVRGNPQLAGDVVSRGFMQVVSRSMSPEAVPLPIPDDECGRLQLARWLTAPDNPLVARVLVNRVWAHLFGRGIVPTVDNFGSRGEPPSHPELLDWLAIAFQEEGLSIKRLVRRMVMSRTYRLGPADPEADRKLLAADPGNLLFGRRVPRSLDAESLRDAVLFVSGQLEWSSGGTQIPANLRDESEYVFTSNLRSVYVPRFRNNLLEMLQTFDVANPALAVGQRDQTIIPTQALYLFNSRFIVDQSRFSAVRVLEAAQDDEERIVRMYRRTLSRDPGKRELSFCRAFLADVRVAHADDPTTAWAALQQTLFQCVDFRFVR